MSYVTVQRNKLVPITSDGSPFKPSGCWPCNKSSKACNALLQKCGWFFWLSLISSNTLQSPIPTIYNNNTNSYNKQTFKVLIQNYKIPTNVCEIFALIATILLWNIHLHLRVVSYSNCMLVETCCSPTVHPWNNIVYWQNDV